MVKENFMKYIFLILILFAQSYSFPDFFSFKKEKKNDIQIIIEKKPVKMYWLKLDKGGYMVVGNPPENGCREISDFQLEELKKAVKRNIKTGKKTLFVKSLNGEIYLGKEPVYDDGRRFHIYGFNPTTGISLREYNKLLKLKNEDENEFKKALKNWIPEEELPKKLWLICKERKFTQEEVKYTVKIYPINLEVRKPDVKITEINLKNSVVEMEVSVFPFFPLKSDKNISSLNLNPFQRNINIAFNLKLENLPKLEDNTYIALIPEKINGKKVSYLYSWWGKKEKFAVGSERIYTNPDKIELKICKIKVKKKKEKIDPINDEIQILGCNLKNTNSLKFKGAIKFIVDADFNDNIPDIWTENEPEWIGTPVNRKPKEFLKSFYIGY